MVEYYLPDPLSLYKILLDVLVRKPNFESAGSLLNHGNWRLYPLNMGSHICPMTVLMASYPPQASGLAQVNGDYYSVPGSYSECSQLIFPRINTSASETFILLVKI